MAVSLNFLNELGELFELPQFLDGLYNIFFDIPSFVQYVPYNTALPVSSPVQHESYDIFYYIPAFAQDAFFGILSYTLFGLLSCAFFYKLSKVSAYCL
jgi:hypothetical protein